MNQSMFKQSKQFKLYQDLFFKSLFFISAFISSIMIFVIIIFIAQKGISPFLANYSYGQQDILSFLTGMVWRQDQAIYGVGFIVINSLI